MRVVFHPEFPHDQIKFQAGSHALRSTELAYPILKADSGFSTTDKTNVW